ncbi:prolipoprotein diacylglyceryl transferase [Rhizobium cremeum]|uniref:prolipoprotein diacylglyceryl transferase n=1 Tax=Rhizobium cremeum TaxID=2813827 RepID=UPI0039E0B2C8
MSSATALLSILTFPAIDPVAFSIGPLAIHWYGLAYVCGIMLGWVVARAMVRNEKLWPAGTPPCTAAHLDDFLVWVAIGIVLGGRLGYILFYDLPSVIADPLRAIEVWNGGMSFHGGFAGATIAMILFARRHAIPIWSLFDIVASVAPIGIFFGRIANFVNGELWGRPSDVAWAMVFPTGGPFPRHPSQLYEALLEGLLMFVLLQIIGRAGGFRMRGLVTGCFVSLYAVARIAVEFFREPDPQLGYLAGGWLTMGMLLSLPMLAVGLWALWRARCTAS